MALDWLKSPLLAWSRSNRLPLSKKLKKGISGTHCQSEEDAVHAVEDILDSQEKDVFDRVIEALYNCWQKSIDIEGDFVEN